MHVVPHAACCMHVLGLPLHTQCTPIAHKGYVKRRVVVLFCGADTQQWAPLLVPKNSTTCMLTPGTGQRWHWCDHREVTHGPLLNQCQVPDT
jgi:hypothetical protein